jgi:ring-1,2-phenylacetyl-CoA epoxidase subunit PaaA
MTLSTPGDRAMPEVASPEEALAMGPEFVTAVGKVLASHVRNELAGASAFDEPAIALAPTPRDKWLACRIAMEEFGHHLQFGRLATDLGLDQRGRVLSVFDYQLTTWVEFVVLKAIVDLAEVIVMEDLSRCRYLPLRRLAERLLPEERFHVSFGQVRTRVLAADPATRPAVQQAITDLVRLTLPFFGRSDSANNAAFLHWGIKHHTNDEARSEFIDRSRRFVVGDLGLAFPDVEVRWDGAGLGQGG